MERNSNRPFRAFFLLVAMALALGIRPAFGERYSNRGSQFFNSGYGGGGYFNNNLQGEVNFDNSQEVPGFSNLLKFGNELIERNHFGEVSRLIIGQDGTLFGATEAETIRQLREFYLINRDKFKGNAKKLVDRFLLANGGFSDGVFTIDLNAFPLPGVPAQNKCKMALATLNFLLNTLQTNVTIRVPEAKACPSGIVRLNLSPFFREEALGLLSIADPSSKCNGGKIRLDTLVAFTMDPPTYYRFINAPPKRRDLANALGFQEDPTATLHNKVLVSSPTGGRESGPAGTDERVIEVQPTYTGHNCYRSLDSNDHNASGFQNASRSPHEKGIFFTHDAEEWLCRGDNGFIQGFIYNNPQGDRKDKAPAEIATDGNLIAPEVAAVESCLDCHKDGFIFGSPNPPRSHTGGKPYTDNFKNGRIPNFPTVFTNEFGQQIFNRDFFTSNDKYWAIAKADNDDYKSSLIRAGAFYPDPTGKQTALIPTFVDNYDKPVKPEVAANELHISQQEAAAVVGKEMSRKQFDSQFCNLRVGKPLFLSEGQQEQLLDRETEDSFESHLGF